jgi:hypothetical protein
MSLPVNQRRAEIVAAPAALAAEAGLSLPHLALAFVRAHPAITSVLLGPRTPGQLDDLLSGAEVTLPGDVLDRIDELVPPRDRGQPGGQLPGGPAGDAPQGTPPPVTCGAGRSAAFGVYRLAPASRKIMGRSRKTSDPGHSASPIYHEITSLTTHFWIPL